MTISESDYNEIISELGVPVVQASDLEFSEEEIKNLFIMPALREFFVWFPKEHTLSTQIAGSFSIDFPDEYTYGVIDARLNTTASGTTKSSSPFMNEILFNSRVSQSSGAYGTNNDYDFQAAAFMSRAERRSTIEYSKSYKVSVDDINRVVKGFTNISGELIITWAKYSENFSDIPFRRKSEAIDLSKSKLLKGFAMLRGQMNADTGLEFDVQNFEDRARDLEEKTLEKWKSMTKVVLMRG